LHNEFWSAEAELRAELYRGTWAHFDLLAGFCFVSMDEALDIERQDFHANITTLDSAGTHNRFYGGQLGAELVIHWYKCFVDLWGKVALGSNDETINVNGGTLTAGQPVVGGFLAPPEFIGSHHHDQFAVVPQIGVNVGYELTQHLRATAGYTFLYLSEAVRPGAETDALSRSPRSAPFPFQTGEFWGQGLNLGIEFRF
jgi:hypothetical protein